MKKYASLLLTIAVVILFAWYALTHGSMFTDIGHIALWALVLIIAGKLLNIWTTGLFTKWTVEAFTDTLSQRESFVIAVLTAVGNFFGPLFGGLGVRAIYLKKYHDLPYSKFTATLVGYYLMMFQFNSLLAIAGLVVLPHVHQTSVALLIFGAWFAAFAGLMFVKLPARLRGVKPLKVLYDIEDGWRVMLGRPKLLWQMLWLSAINLAALYVVNWVEFVALGVHSGWAALALYTAIVQASMLLAITPGAVGIREGLLLLVASTLGITDQQIVQVAVLDRGIYFIMLALLFLATRHSRLRQSFTQSSGNMVK